MADDVSEKFVRGVRAGLNGLLDQIKQFDFDDDGSVGAGDLTLLLERWGDC